MLRFCFYFLFCLLAFNVNAQLSNMTGYVYAKNNSGFQDDAEVKIVDSNGKLIAELTTTNGGKFSYSLSQNASYSLTAAKVGFKPETINFDIGPDSVKYLKVPIDRLPGYLFEATMSETLADYDLTDSLVPEVAAIDNARIEIFNNTTKKEEVVWDKYDKHIFHYRFEQGNQYLIMIRKDGYYSKRIMANVNVNGCILCFDGIGSMNPGVVDNLTRENTMGTLASNITIRKLRLDVPVEIPNVSFDGAKLDITPATKSALDKFYRVLVENPQIKVAIMAHTDCRGEARVNQQLSEKRALKMVDYLIKKGIASNRLQSSGMGESKLKNKCADGVKCSEAEHAENRRYEYKIVELLPIDEEIKPFRRIVKEEDMEKFLELANSDEYIEVPADFKSTPKPTSEAQDNIPVPAGVAKSKPSQPVEVVQSLIPIKKIEPILEPEVSVVSAEPNPEIKTEASLTNDPFFNNKISPVPTYYTGFMVLIRSGDTILPKKHDIFSQFGNLYGEERDGKYDYLIGSFSKKSSAEWFVSNSIAEKFKDAKIIEYKSGKRVE